MTVRIAVSRWEDVVGETMQRYWQRLRENGVEPVDICSPTDPLVDSGWSGLVLTGGLDVDPARYGHERHERVRHVDAERDEFELMLLNKALAADIPVLAICRGHQLLNVAFGGALLQHIDSGEHVADYRSEGYPSRSHGVAFEAGTKLHQVLGPAPITVNSRHHQAVTPETLAPGLLVSARTPDGLIEGLESPRHRWVIGVQWHPEREDLYVPGFAETGRALFAAFAAAVRAT